LYLAELDNLPDLVAGFARGGPMRGWRLALLAIGAGVVSVAADAPPPSTYQQEMERQAQEEAEREAVWRQRWREHVAAEKQAEKRLEVAREDRRQMGDHYTWRGKPRADVLRELDDAEKAVERARKDLRRFYDEARREGVPPGWVGHPD
jgi:hypothetical protein